MSKKSKFTELGAIASLSRKKDLRFKGHEINILGNKSREKNNDLGNGSWAKVEFLVKHCGYRSFFVEKF